MSEVGGESVEANSLEITSLGVWDLSAVENVGVTDKKKKLVFENGNQHKEL